MMAIHPPKMETRILKMNNLTFMLPLHIIEIGSNPSLPNNFRKNILPKTPAIEFPVIPKEYLLTINLVKLAPITPQPILIKEIIVSVMRE